MRGWRRKRLCPGLAGRPLRPSGAPLGRRPARRERSRPPWPPPRPLGQPKAGVRGAHGGKTLRGPPRRNRLQGKGTRKFPVRVFLLLKKVKKMRRRRAVWRAGFRVPHSAQPGRRCRIFRAACRFFYGHSPCARSVSSHWARQRRLTCTVHGFPVSGWAGSWSVWCGTKPHFSCTRCERRFPS